MENEFENNRRIAPDHLGEEAAETIRAWRDTLPNYAADTPQELDADDFPHPPMPPWLQDDPANPPIDLPDDLPTDEDRQRENRTIALIAGIIAIIPMIFIILYFATKGHQP